MATQCFYCNQCHKKYPTHQKLFDTLYDSPELLRRIALPAAARGELRVSWISSSGAGDGEFKVVSGIPS